MEIIEQNITTILRPTGINLAPYVINPYQGCELGCLFCYAQFSKKARKEILEWGEYVRVKLNALKVLERELAVIKPIKVLLGSTTECFQPIEKKYRVTKAIIQKLNEYNIPYIILSRSLLIKDYIPLLKNGSCEAVYFTIDTLPQKIQNKFEPRAPRVNQSIDTANALIKGGIKTILYCCPILPWISEWQSIVERVEGASRVEFEMLNFKMAKVDQIMLFIEKEYPKHKDKFTRLLRDSDFYYEVVDSFDNEVKKLCSGNINIHRTEFDDFFKNKY